MGRATANLLKKKLQKIQSGVLGFYGFGFSGFKNAKKDEEYTLNFVGLKYRNDISVAKRGNRTRN